MAAGLETPIYFMAFDHRVSLMRGLFDATAANLRSADRAWIARAKVVVLDGLSMVLTRGVDAAAAAFLVDEEFGAEAAREARSRGITLAMPVEQSGRTELALE